MANNVAAPMLEPNISKDATKAAQPAELKTGVSIDPPQLTVIVVALNELRSISSLACNCFLYLCRDEEHVASAEHLNLVVGCDLATVTPNIWHRFAAGISDDFARKKNGA